MTSFFNAIVPTVQPKGTLVIPDAAWAPLAQALNSIGAELVVRLMPAKSSPTGKRIYWIKGIVQGDGRDVGDEVFDIMRREIQKLQDEYTHTHIPTRQ